MSAPTEDELRALEIMAAGAEILANRYDREHGLTDWMLWRSGTATSAPITAETARSLRDRGWILQIPRTNRFRVCSRGLRVLRIFRRAAA